MKNRSDFDSYTAAEAAAILHVSVPTLKKMVDDGRLKSFRTSGGHVRVAVESIKALRDTRSVHDVSPVLQNRRDQIEETVLETQALRAKRDLAKLQQEQQEETDRH
jgi:excisionase family DNA binding protein